MYLHSLKTAQHIGQCLICDVCRASAVHMNVDGRVFVHDVSPPAKLPCREGASVFPPVALQATGAVTYLTFQPHALQNREMVELQDTTVAAAAEDYYLK